MSLERAAFDAWEAGYFPDVPVPAWDSSDNMHPVTVEMLIAAFERELADEHAHLWGGMMRSSSLNVSLSGSALSHP